MKSMHYYLETVRDTYLRCIIEPLPVWITPNSITLFRLCLALPLYIAHRMDHPILMLAIFLFAFSLDLIDGTLARIRKQITWTGKMLDPLVDKLLFLLAFWWLVGQALPLGIAFGIIAIEFLTALMGAFGFLFVVFHLPITGNANMFGKLKTAFQVLGIISFSFSFAICSFISVSIIFFFFAIVLGIISSLYHVGILIKNTFRETNFK